MSLEEILNELEKQSTMSREELLEKINKKYNELSSLITQEGAAHLVAKELGVDLLEKTKRQLQIKNIVPGMRNVNVVGRIFKISPVNEFERSNGRKGRVINLFIGDSSGYSRLPLWNDQAELVEEESIKLGDVIEIANGMAKENIFGETEISLGKFGRIERTDAELPSIEELTKNFLFFVPEKTFIKGLVPGSFEIKAIILYVFKTNFLFDVCSICGGKLIKNRCLEHGEVEPSHALVINTIVDDSTGSIRAVFFRELAEKLITTQASELSKLSQEERYELISKKLVGKELTMSGNVKKNKMFDRLELIANNFKDLNILEESKKLAEELESKVS